MFKIVFQILHYKTLNDTIDCINSITNLKHYNFTIEILIVDNGFEELTSKKLIELYKDITNINIISLKENIGFSKGNNAGYKYIDRENIDLLIVVNNDVVFNQIDFLYLLYNSYKKNRFHVLGPDIIENDINFNNLIHHVNPLALHLRTYDEIERLVNYQKAYLLNLKKGIKNISFKDKIRSKIKNTKIYYLRYKYIINKKNRYRNVSKLQRNVCLYGACLVFSGEYLKKFSELFYPETFLYAEEDLLFLRAIRNDLLLIYDPMLIVSHKGKSSTKFEHNDNIELEIFRTKHEIKSLMIYQQELKKQY